MNRVRLLEFSSFLFICHAENMSACLKENLGFFKFFTETDSLKQKRALLENIIEMHCETYQGKYTNAFNPTLHNGERIIRDLNPSKKESNKK